MRETYHINLVGVTGQLRNKFQDMVSGCELAIQGLGTWAYFIIQWSTATTICFDTNAPQLVSKLRKEFSNFGIDIVKE